MSARRPRAMSLTGPRVIQRAEAVIPVPIPHVEGCAS